MGKAARQKRKMKKAAEKRAQKARNQAQYDEWRRTGQNKKSKRAKTSGKKKKAANGGASHPDGACGNIGCKQCYPRIKRLAPRQTTVAHKKLVKTITKAN